jgi:hypothetical protein
VKEKPMTFDELWRLNLDPDGACVDSVDKDEAAGLIAPPAENPNELQLTTEDCAARNEGDERFPLEKIPQDSAQRHTFRHNSISVT